MKTSYLSLKWGTLKEWKFVSEEEKTLAKKYFDFGVIMGAAQQNNSLEQKEIICKLIELCTEPKGIFLDWDGEFVTKEKAKEYVLNYGKKR